jgi:glycosyltransferase involved in cell wall biosynthesis
MIVYLSNARIPTEKAHGIQIFKMCEAFAAAGAQVTLTHPHRIQPPSLRGVDPFAYYGVQPSFELRRLFSLDLHDVLPDRLQGWWFPLLAGSSALASFLYTFPHWRNPSAILYSRDRRMMALLLSCRPLIRARLVYEAHTFFGRSRRWFVPLLRRLDRLVVLTHQLERLYTEAGVPSELVSVEPDAADLEQFQIADTRQACRHRLGLPTERSIVGYVGRFYTMGMGKGIPELIQAMAALLAMCPEHPPLLLCVGGPMDRVPAYEALARQRGVPLEHMRFVDRVPHAEVPYWMRACDVCTIPWPWTEFSAYYTSPMKLFEYMAVGTPIVASDLPSLREVLRHNENALLVEPGNAQDLAAGIGTLLEQPDLGQRLASCAAQKVRDHTWHKRAQRILSTLAGIG